MRDLSNSEPESLAQAHWLAQPKWVRVVTIAVGLPVWFGWMFMIVSGQFFENKNLALGMFAVFAVVVLLQMFFVARAYWRMDI